ncbi:MAG: Tim44 domain-containing protein [Rhodospirillales bacterium]|jgi:predicted lipid-binding transport protein (Tim44 family)|nr:Tim44 domain-containing protein [Rhodospirillales bacterium]
MNTGGFPVDLILFGMIAVFLILRLRSILGRRTGFERPPQQFQAPPGGPQAGGARPAGPIIDGHAESAAPAGGQVGGHAGVQAGRHGLPDPASPSGQALAQMRAIDAGFDPAAFLGRAEQAFRMIVGAFAAGNRTALHPLVSDDVYRAFEQAIAAREAAGHQQTTEIRAVPTVAIEAAELRGHTAQVTLRFVSDQVSLTRDAAGHPVAGTDAVTELTDVWTFERDLTSGDPTWRLVSVRGG